MAEYIDRKKAIKAIESMPNCYNGFSDTYDKACIIGVLEEVLAADVVERKHGKWIDGNCSVCGKGKLCYGDRSFCTSPYCPWCGAYMIESEE